MLIPPPTVSFSIGTHPDEQLCDDHIGHGTREVQSGASVSVPVGLINLLLGAVGQQQHHQPQVILHHCPKQLLPQGHVGLGQSHQEQFLLVLGSDPALLLLPGGEEITQTQQVRQSETLCYTQFSTYVTELSMHFP